MGDRILVTGAAGYIGSVLVRQLLERDCEVRGFDSLSFGGESLLGAAAHRKFEFVRGDVRDRDALGKALDGVGAVVHLAAIVGDPACAKQPELARAVNWKASKSLFELCQERASIERFVFASTCSNYGKMTGEGFVKEDSPLNPVSLYAQLKVKFEQYLVEASSESPLVATSLRFATVYGLSPRPRFDLTVNEFTRDATLGRGLQIFGEQFWRPYCHVEDLARACVAVIEADAAAVRGEVFGVGDTNQNYQKRMLAEAIQEIVPGLEVEYVHRDEDPRDYRVDFSRIRDELGFRITKTVPDGVLEIHRAVRDGLISDPDSPAYRNV